MHDLVLTAPCRKVCVRARSNATTLLGLPAKSQRKSVCDIWVAWTAAEALLAPPCLTLSARRRTFNATSPGARKSMVKVLQEVGGRANLPEDRRGTNTRGIRRRFGAESRSRRTAPRYATESSAHRIRPERARNEGSCCCQAILSPATHLSARMALL